MHTSLQAVDFTPLPRKRGRGWGRGKKGMLINQFPLPSPLPQAGEGTCVHRLALMGEGVNQRFPRKNMEYRFLWHSMPSLTPAASYPKTSLTVKLKNAISVSA